MKRLSQPLLLLTLILFHLSACDAFLETCITTDHGEGSIETNCTPENAP